MRPVTAAWTAGSDLRYVGWDPAGASRRRRFTPGHVISARLTAVAPAHSGGQGGGRGDVAVSAPFRPGDRVDVRDRPWRVEAVHDIAPGRWLLRLLPAEADGTAPLAVVHPPERVHPLPPERLSFDLRELGPIGPWLTAHRALSIAAIRADALAGARYGRVALETYQLAPVLRILTKPRPSLLIADDVGLGKTIEAGLCLLELMVRRRADRVLVVVPAGLVLQWHGELRERFGLDFTLIENASALAQAQAELPAGLSPWELPRARIITSVDYLKRPEVRRRALVKRWDLVIVDEAHALAESGTPRNPYLTDRARLGRELRSQSRGLLLLTATPHNGYAHSFRSLIELVEPTAAAVDGPSARERIDRAMVRRMKRQIVRRDDGVERPAFVLRFPPRGLAVPSDPATKEVFRAVAAYCTQVRRAATHEDEELVSFAMQIVKKRAASSRRALERTLEHRLGALLQEDEREEKPSPGELHELQADLPLTEEQADRLARRVLRSAIPRDERLRENEVRGIRHIQRLLRQATGPDPKIAALLAHLQETFAEDPAAKVIVFTEYRDTLAAIRDGLDSAGAPFAGSYVQLVGGMTARRREEVQAQFEGPGIRVLLATDAASEGLNLQRACHRLVHVELPWNPNRLEQRNGRIDRYGQTRRPVISYLYYPDSPEEDVLARLIEKIEAMASASVSTPDVLGVVSGMDLEGQLARLGFGDEGAKERLVRDFEDRTAEFVRETMPLIARVDGPDTDRLDPRDWLRRADPLLPDDLELERLLGEALGSAAFRPTDVPGIFSIDVPWRYRAPGVAERYPRATTRRSLAVTEPASKLEFLTPLHPLVQAIAAEARRHFVQVYPDRGLPPKRLAARRVPAGEPASVLFTFVGTITGREGPIEELLVPVRLDLDARPVADLEGDLAFLRDASSPGEVPAEALGVFRDRFDDLLERASEEAHRRARERADGLRVTRQGQAEELRRDAEAFRRDRLEELQVEEAAARGQIDAGGQIRLVWAAETRAPYGFDSRRAAVETHYRERLEEIDAYATVVDPSPPVPIAALFCVPEEAE